MAKIVLVSCGSKKLQNDARAEDLYIGTPFRKQLAYAKLLQPDEIFILSAKHHLLSLDKVISPYNVTLLKMSPGEVKEWGRNVSFELKRFFDLSKDEFTVLASETYTSPLESFIHNIYTPLKGKRQGERLKFLNNKIQELS